MTVSPARRAAFEILRRVESEAAYASVLLAELDARMREDDRALCHELVLGVLRQRLWLDRSLAHFANRPVERMDIAVRIALELGLYQMRFLSRIPRSAAVNESVNLVRAGGVKSATSFANAVLRRAAREPDFDPVLAIDDPIENIAVASSHPAWLIDRWKESFGIEEAERLARANNQPAPTSFRLTARATAAEKSRDQILGELASAGLEIVPSRITRDAWRLALNRTTRDGQSVGTGQDAVEPQSRSIGTALLRGLVLDGLIYLQDEASQLVAHLLNAQPGHRVLDVTAAPGSKATCISMLAPEAMIIAGDLNQHRIATTLELSRAQGARLHLLAHDATRPLPFQKESFDRVLLDAPCSGTGTLRRNPEIRWRLQPEEIDEISAQQREMLSHAADMVRPGGRLIYSTCSVEIEENEAVARAFQESHPDFVPAEFDAARELQTGTGAIRTWPHRDDVDGFFVAGFERKTGKFEHN